jgi:aconitase A
MMRGTFGNIRIKNLMVAPKEGSFTIKQPEGKEMSNYDAAMKYRQEGVPLVVLAGKEYGTGSSRDWAAKGSTYPRGRDARADRQGRRPRGGSVRGSPGPQPARRARS